MKLVKVENIETKVIELPNGATVTLPDGDLTLNRQKGFDLLDLIDEGLTGDFFFLFDGDEIAGLTPSTEVVEEWKSQWSVTDA